MVAPSHSKIRSFVVGLAATSFSLKRLDDAAAFSFIYYFLFHFLVSLDEKRCGR